MNKQHISNIPLNASREYLYMFWCKPSVACHITFYTFRWCNNVHWYMNAFHLLRHIPTLITNSFGTNKWMIMISLAMKRMHNFQCIPKVLSPNKSNGNKWRLSMFIHIYMHVLVTTFNVANVNTSIEYQIIYHVYLHSIQIPICQKLMWKLLSS